MGKLKITGAYKAGEGSYIFNVEEMSGVKAGPEYLEAFGPVIEGELTQVGVMILPAGQTSQPDFHPNEQWVYVLKGSFEVSVDGQEAEVNKGHLIYFPANIIHSVTVSSDEYCHFSTCKELRSRIAGPAA